jgi:hypothetical protein
LALNKEQAERICDVQRNMPVDDEAYDGGVVDFKTYEREVAPSRQIYMAT